ncbi:B12-binding domain-containing radical SAM protein [Cellulosilyticum lentocellum]|uniref:Radical SAM domain protein n=1 Tax=Cellulosilyticum lentocellum (strain ATCC 49066 / DSM 5427 / NCIMB 11756 / RHM5) TaxID=642492 RepID=F2JNF0_CELLD|nr:radical SAM protein [Cellulosilyticum lentocellum]ADZ84726.1 Radical SAM domain protein [Cellulosilyticum lentocellum DSM 5427]
MLDVLLLNSPLEFQKSKNKEQYLPPIGLGYIMTYLLKDNINAKLNDCIYLNQNFDEICHLIRSKKPRYLGINVFSTNIHIVKEIVKKIPKDIKVIIGGQLVKCIYKEIASWNVEHKIIAVCGEGELIIPDIIKESVKEKPIMINDNCTVYRVDNTSIYFPEDISQIVLDRNLFKNRILKNRFNLQEACMVSSRGCIYNCAFCGGAKSLNEDICTRIRSKDSIIDEINEIKKVNPEVQSIRMLDDLFLRSRRSIKEAIEIFQIVQLKWRAMAHIYSFRNNQDLLQELSRCGCLEVFVGIETGSNRMRKKINKLGTAEEVYECIKAILNANINVKGYFMYGLPEENLEDMQETYRLARELKEASENTKAMFRNSTFQFRPYHGTLLYEQLKEKNIKLEGIQSNNSLNSIKGRTQFNYSAGNFSECPDNVLNDFIINTLKMNED